MVLVASSTFATLSYLTALNRFRSQVFKTAAAAVAWSLVYVNTFPLLLPLTQLIGSIFGKNSYVDIALGTNNKSLLNLITVINAKFGYPKISY